MKNLVLALLVGLVSLSTVDGVFASETREFKVKAVEIDGAKFWLPSTLVVYKGDEVKISAESRIAGAGNLHGFKIEAYKVEEIVDSKGKEIHFKADKAGIFSINCQMHPAHVGGQLIVLDK